MPVHILLTKADKLKKGLLPAGLTESSQPHWRLQAALVSVQLFSSLKHSGHEQLARGA